MESERVEGTIVVDPRPGRPLRGPGGLFADSSLPGVELVVDYGGEIAYAVTGERGQRLWWFAGLGNVEERS